MKTPYRIIAVMGVICATLDILALMAAIYVDAPSEERTLLSISSGVYWLLAAVASGNADRLEQEGE